MKTRNLIMTALLGVALMAFGCQPDQRSPNWQNDAGDDASTQPDTDGTTETWSGEWTSLPSVHGGRIVGKVDGKLVARGWGQSGRMSATAYSSDGRSWQPPENSPLMSRISGSAEFSHAKTDAADYLLVRNEDGAKTYRMAFKGGTLSQTILGGIREPTSIHSVEGQLMVLQNDGALKLRTGEETWKDIAPTDRMRGQAEIAVFGSTIVVDTKLTSKTFVSTDLGQTWAEPAAPGEYRANLTNIATLGESLYTLGRTNDGGGLNDPSEWKIWLLKSADGAEWRATELEVDVPLMVGSIAELDGELYALDLESRLVRIDREQGTTELMVDADFEASNQAAKLWKVGSRLATTAREQNSAILTWGSGEDRWSLPPALPARTTTLAALEGELWAKAGVLQKLQSPAIGWDHSIAPRTTDLWTPSDKMLAHRKYTDCLYRRTEDGWETGLKWVSSGTIVGRCPERTSAGYISDAVAYREGFAVSRTGEILTTGGQGDPDLAGNGGLVYWNPEEGTARVLVPEEARDQERPRVASVANAGGTLWVQTNEGDGLPGSSATFYRVDEDEWTAKTPAVVDEDGQRHEDGASILGTDMRGYGSDLMAVVGYPKEGSDDKNVAFGRWDAQSQAFEVLPTAADDVIRRTFTEVGPVAITPDEMRTWDRDSDGDGWARVAGPLPVDGSDIVHVTSDPDAFYISSQTGLIWQTRRDAPTDL